MDRHLYTRLVLGSPRMCSPQICATISSSHLVCTHCPRSMMLCRCRCGCLSVLLLIRVCLSLFLCGVLCLPVLLFPRMCLCLCWVFFSESFLCVRLECAWCCEFLRARVGQMESLLIFIPCDRLWSHGQGVQECRTFGVIGRCFWG